MKETLKLALEALEYHTAQTRPIEQTNEAITAIKEALAQPAPMRMRRGDILRCIETDELCTVWSTSTTGKTLIKWGANDFDEYTAEQIGELFWLEPSPDDLEIAAEKSDNYAAFHAGYRFAVAHSLAQPEQEPVAWKLMPREATREMLEAMDECSTEGYDERLYAGHAGSVYMAAWDAFAHPPVPTAQPKEPEQEPVAWELGEEVYWNDSPELSDYIRKEGTPLYTTPPQPKEPEQEPDHDQK